jgi:hypothetical protein
VRPPGYRLTARHDADGLLIGSGVIGWGGRADAYAEGGRAGR